MAQRELQQKRVIGKTNCINIILKLKKIYISFRIRNSVRTQKISNAYPVEIGKAKSK